MSAIRFIILMLATLTYAGKAQTQEPVDIDLVKAHCEQKLTQNKDCSALKLRLKKLATPKAIALLGLANMYLSEDAPTKERKTALTIKAQKYFTQAIDLAPNNTDILMLTGIFANEKQQIAILEKVIIIEPEQHLNYYLMARIYLQNKSTQHKAIDTLLRGYQKLKGDGRWYIAGRLYDIYKMLGQTQQAQTYRVKVLSDMTLNQMTTKKKFNVSRTHTLCSHFALILDSKAQCLDELLLFKKFKEQLIDLPIDQSLKVVAAVKGVYRKMLQANDNNSMIKHELIAILDNLSIQVKNTDDYLLTLSLFADGENKISILQRIIDNDGDEQFKAMFWLAEHFLNNGQIKQARQIYAELERLKLPLWSDRATGQLTIMNLKNNS